MEKTKILKLVLEIVRDVNGANKQNGTTWAQWNLSDIEESYKFPDMTVKNIVKNIISNGIKTNGGSLDADIKKLEQNAA